MELSADAQESPARRLSRARLRPLTARQGRLAVTAEPVRFRTLIAYDGAAYAGWQRQPALVSIQELLEVAVERVTGVPARVHGAGRTDSGVHAEGQAAAVDCASGLPPHAIEALLGQVLPHDVAVRRFERAPADFNPQRGVVQKLYRYSLLIGAPPLPTRGRLAWQLPGPLDLDAMRAAATHLIGRHDFRAFRNDPGPERRDENTVRTVDAIALEQMFDTVRIDVTGPGFLYMMVRNLTAALVAVGVGELQPDDVRGLLAARDRRRVPAPAPARGLTLVWVEYDDGYGRHGR